MIYYDDNTIIYNNGEFIKASEARGNVYSQTLHYGYGAFEGIRAYNTGQGVKIFKATEHYERMKFSCESIGIPYPFDNEELIDISYELLQRNHLKDAYLRPLVTCPPNMSLTKAKDSELLIIAWEWGAYLGEKLLKLKTSSYRRIAARNFKVEAKVCGHYVNSILAAQEAKDLGYDEALLLDIDGFVAEGPGSNVFIEKNNALYTPQTGSILPGITRATVIEIAKDLGIAVIEKQVTLQDVYGADGMFLCGTAAEIVGVASLDDQTFKRPWSDSMGLAIQGAYKNLVQDKKYTNISIVA